MCGVVGGGGGRGRGRGVALGGLGKGDLSRSVSPFALLSYLCFIILMSINRTVLSFFLRFRPP